jgi:hypothetical protein
MILAGVCLIAAAFFGLRGDLDTAFVVATLGLVAWFLNDRAQLKEVIVQANRQDEASENQKESCENSDDY